MKKSSSANKAEWGSLQLLYKLYNALAQEFSIDLSPCDELQDGEKTATRKAVGAAREWFAAADERIQVHQLRQFLQTSRLADEAGLRAALGYALHKPEHSEADRDKIDFLSVQFFSVCAPSLLEDNDLTFQFVAKTLEPVLGTRELVALKSLEGLDDVVQKAETCHSLRELYASGVIEKGRELKQGAAQNYFEPAALVSFTRFNFLMRRCFFRAMHRDLNAILDGLRELEQRGVAALDCRGAELSEEEPVGRLRIICQSWKAMFQAEYSFGQPLRMLVDLRAAVDTVLAAGSKETSPKAGEPDGPPRAMAAAASGDSDGSTQANESESNHDTQK